MPRLFPSIKEEYINHFYQIDELDDELSRSSNDIIETEQCNDLALQ